MPTSLAQPMAQRRPASDPSLPPSVALATTLDAGAAGVDACSELQAHELRDEGELGALGPAGDAPVSGYPGGHANRRPGASGKRGSLPPATAPTSDCTQSVHCLIDLRTISAANAHELPFQRSRRVKSE